MSNIQTMLRESLDDALADFERMYGKGKKNLGDSIRNIQTSAAQFSHGHDNHKKYINADGSLTPAAEKLNGDFKRDNPTSKPHQIHPIVSGAISQHEKTKR